MAMTQGDLAALSTFDGALKEFMQARTMFQHRTAIQLKLDDLDKKLEKTLPADLVQDTRRYNEVQEIIGLQQGIVQDEMYRRGFKDAMRLVFTGLTFNE